MDTVSFRGGSGRAYAFNRVSNTAPWARNAGIAVFVAPDAYGWRVISVVDVTGRSHDIRPFWAFRQAERFGASAVFFMSEQSKTVRTEKIVDIEAGITPVMGRSVEHFIPVAA